MRKIIFLDVDGVLNCWDCENPTAPDPDLPLTIGIDQELLKNLRTLLEQTKASIVLSSSWRILRKHRCLLRKRSGIHWIGTTPDLGNRGKEIKHWIEEHGQPSDRYAIIDDENHILLSQSEFFFKTNHTTGLTEKLAREIADCLNRT